MFIFYLVLILAPVILLYWAYQLRIRVKLIDDQLGEINYDHEQLKSALLTGLYYRFNGEGTGFEHFVAKVVDTYYGGFSYVTPATRDYGVDIELTKSNGENKELYLGQVKCEKNKLNYRPIAIIHSQMLKQNAAKGFIVTTSDFTKYARYYAEDLNIELIDGRRFIDIWLASLQINKERALVPAGNEQLIPENA